jgi:hypothetical protein
VFTATRREGTTLSWCDKVSSSPSIGLLLDRHYMSSADLLDSLAPLLDRSVKEDQDESIVDRQEPFVVQLTFNNGFHYGIDPSKVFLDFQHRLRVKHIGGGLWSRGAKAIPY